MHHQQQQQQQRTRVSSRIVAAIVVSLLLLLGGFVNFQPTIAAVTHELIRVSEMRTQLAEAKLAAFKHYMTSSGRE